MNFDIAAVEGHELMVGVRDPVLLAVFNFFVDFKGLFDDQTHVLAPKLMQHSE